MRAQLWRERRLPWVFVIVMLLSIVAAMHGSRQHTLLEHERQTAEQLDRQTFIGQGLRNPHSVAHFSRFAMRPAVTATMLDPGIRPYAGSAVWMEAHWQSLPSLRQAEDQVDLGRSVEMSPAWLAQIVLPLLLILLGFDAVAREREHKTLVLLRGNGLTMAQFVIAKTLMLWQIACLLLAITLAVTVASALFTGAAIDTNFIVRCLTWFVLHAVYLAIWSMIIIGVSMRTRPMVAFLCLIAVWVMSALVAPRLSTTLAESLVPIPSPDAFAKAINDDRKNGINGHDPSDKRRKALEEKTLKKYGVSRLEDLPVSFAGIALQESERYGNQVFDHHFGALEQMHLNQASIRRAFAVLSPLIALQPLSRSTADSGLHSHIHFIHQAESQRRHIVAALNDDMIHNAAGKDFEYQTDESLWQTIPEYQHTTYSLTDALINGIKDLLALIIWFALCFWGLRQLIHLEEKAS